MFDLDDAVREWRREFTRERTFSVSDLDELEDHLRAAFEVELDLDPGLTPARAFTYASENLGAATALSGEFAKVEGKGWRRLVRTGRLLFLVSFFLPVVDGGISLVDANVHDGFLPGIQAFLVAVRWGGAFGIASALTNLFMIPTFRRISEAGRDKVWLFTALMLAATALNLVWIFDTDNVSDLSAGYWAWLASFALVGTGLLLRARSLPARSDSGEMVVAP